MSEFRFAQYLESKLINKNWSRLATWPQSYLSLKGGRRSDDEPLLYYKWAKNSGILWSPFSPCISFIEATVNTTEVILRRCLWISETYQTRKTNANLKPCSWVSGIETVSKLMAALLQRHQAPKVEGSRLMFSNGQLSKGARYTMGLPCPSVVFNPCNILSHFSHSSCVL